MVPEGSWGASRILPRGPLTLGGAEGVQSPEKGHMEVTEQSLMDQDLVYHGGPLPEPSLQQLSGSTGEGGTPSLEGMDGCGCLEKWAPETYLRQPWTPIGGCVCGEFPTLDIAFVPRV